MANSPDQVSMALFCDFENVALGVRDANYDKFDIKRILERLLLKGSIVVKKAYCDWDRYKGFKATMHEANFELIEIPHVRQSGKNSADIRLVVDALDLCYTKSHVNTFVIISGDSDFSPLVSKLRENAKKVIGVGVKQSTSDLLIANCDEFIFYDDLVRESQRALARRQPADAPAAPRRSAEEERQRKETLDKRRTQAVEIAVETFDALVSERGDSGKIWASVLKEAIKRRKPDFNETYFGFRAFGNLLEEAQARGLLEFGRDEKSGAYVFRSNAAAAQGQAESEGERPVPAQARPAAPARSESASEGKEPRRRGRAGRKPVQVEADVEPEFSEAAESAVQDVEPDDEAQARPARLERALPLQPEVEAKAEPEPEPEFERPSYFRQQAPRPQPVPPAAPEVVEAVEEIEAQPEAEPAPAPVPVLEKAAAPRRIRAPRKTAAKSAVAATAAEPAVAEASPTPLDFPALSEPEALPEPVFAWPVKQAEPVPVKVARPRRARKTTGGAQPD
ncbi:MAG: NYN domain-containing protein [Burkholderiales bacterium]|nr:NYN domain-containing protein [Burkholderiales bacterium]